MSSCCGMPVCSKEPTYPLPEGLEALARRWDQSYPGALQAVVQHIGCGDWDAMEEGQANLPAFTPTRAMDAAIEQLILVLTALETEDRRKRGPWYVRWGLSQPSSALSEEAQQFITQAQRDTRALLSRSRAVQGSEFSYQLRIVPPVF